MKANSFKKVRDKMLSGDRISLATTNITEAMSIILFSFTISKTTNIMRVLIKKLLCMLKNEKMSWIVKEKPAKYSKSESKFFNVKLFFTSLKNCFGLILFSEVIIR
jgi:hypothetical protein